MLFRTPARLFIFVGVASAARLLLKVQFCSKFLNVISKVALVKAIELNVFFSLRTFSYGF